MRHTLAYGPDRCHFGHLHLPEGPGVHPVVVFIHGGYWRARYDLGHADFLCQALAEAGLATWSIEYRRLGNPGGGWPGTFQDVAAAVSHLRKLTGHYPLDLDRVVPMGHSAGGQLALWAAAAPSIPTGHLLAVPHPLPLRGVISLAGVNDLRRAWELRLSGRVVDELLGGGPDQVPERYAVTSPVELLPLGVRQILIHGSRDEDVPLELSMCYHDAATAAGDDVELLILPGEDHFNPIKPGSPAWPHVLRAVTRLLVQS